jgi:hypothetical protein
MLLKEIEKEQKELLALNEEGSELGFLFGPSLLTPKA